MNNKSLTILVTGGAGYIGSFTVKELLDQKYDIVVLDSLENGHKEAVDPRAKLEVADLSDKDATEKVFDKYKIDAVIDFAAYLAVGESMEKPKMYVKNNVENFVKLLDVMVKKGCKYIIKSSTAAVYGNPQNDSVIPLDEDYISKFKPGKSALLKGIWQNSEVEGEIFFQKILELYANIVKPDLYLNEEEITQLRIPSNVYGITKMLDEMILKKYSNKLPIKFISLRYFNAAGADNEGKIGEDHPIETHLIPLALKNILEGSEFKLMGTDYKTKDGTAIRDYVHVIDLADGHLKALQYLIENDNNNIFNLGNGSGYTVNEVIKTIEDLLGKKVDCTIYPRRSGDPDILIADSQKAKKILRWSPQYSLEDIVRSAWKWHKNNPRGYLK
ncbi:MAG: UDP-glucose 4-epimerase [Patescibacteria group bacterium]|nr:UDP-glucose 4-epimerase [Patescibacteria group bacterium]